jgi:hypothetical protein
LLLLLLQLQHSLTLVVSVSPKPSSVGIFGSIRDREQFVIEGTDYVLATADTDKNQADRQETREDKHLGRSRCNHHGGF